MNIAELLQGVTAFAWLVVVGVVAIVVVRATRNRPLPRSGLLILVAVLVAGVISSVSAGLVFVNPQERGVVISAFQPQGYRPLVLEPGLRWVIPFAESVITYPISRQTYTMSIASQEGQIQGDDSIAARTLDGQEIYVDASVIYQIDTTKVIQVHIEWQTRYSDDLIRPVARGIIRDVVSQYKVEEVVSTKRAEMTEKFRLAMAKKLDENGLKLLDFILRNITFTKEYAASVEQKQIAEQQAQQAALTIQQKKNEAQQAREVAQGVADAVVTKAKGDAEARTIQAGAEAEALKRIALALKDQPELLTYLYVTKLSPNIQAMLLPANAPFLFPLPEMQPQTITTPEVIPTLPPPPPTPTPGP